MKIDLKFILLICLIVVAVTARNKTKQAKRIKSDLKSSDNIPRLKHIRNKTRHHSIKPKTSLKDTNSFMYPYTDKGGEENQGDYQTQIQETTPTIQKNLNFKLPFFGFRYNYIRVSLNGHLEFSDPQIYETYPLVFPVKNWPKENDPALIAIFHSKCRLGKLNETDIDQRKPGVYFRIESDLRQRRDRVGIEIRERLKSDIQQANIGANNFDPKYAVIVTWKNISFAGGIDSARHKTNTFQIVLATDEVYTYVMFNYLDLQWTSHTEAGGDVVNGEGGIPAFVGFNAGNGTRSYEYQPFSQNSLIRDLIKTGFGNGMKGRHYFRIDEQIYLDSCDDTLMGFNLPLSFAPESGNMLGGTIVNITGPCFKPTDKIICKFGNAPEVIGVVVDTNRAFCIQPRLEDEGYIHLKLAVNNGYYYYKGQYYIETPATATQNIFFTDMSYNEKSPDEIKILWNTKNLTLNSNAVVQISLWGYRESNGVSEFLYVTDLETQVLNSGEFTIIPSVYKNRENNDVLDVQFGFIQINTTETLVSHRNNIKITPVIWSRPIPLAWYFGPQWERKYGNWSEQFCNNWITQERNKSSFLTQLPECPCTLEQALTDKGRFMPDLNCDKDFNPTCYFHRGAIHCVKTGLPSSQGAEQQCCYDKNHYLMLSQDQKWGSYPRRSHNLPSESSNTIPTLSQWYNDIVPRYVCCMWQEENSDGCETLRTELRPTQDCVNYKSPGVAGIYGDPHIITFDDLQYTFNGQGEFVLVRSYDTNNSLDIQGRFERMPQNPYGEANATQLTSVVARGNTSTIVEVRLRPKEARWRYHLDVFVNSQRVYFDRQSLKYKHSSGVTVYTPSYIFNQSQVIVMFDSGAGVEVMENNGQMSAIVYLPPSFINKTRGLFGNWSLDIMDDLTLPDKGIVPPPATIDMEQIYFEFGLKWMLNDSDDPFKGRALFKREFGRLSSYYNNVSFVPEFSMSLKDLIPESRPQEQHTAVDLCRSFNSECIYDYAMTYDTTFAAATLYFQNNFINLQDITQTKVISCGVLETPRFGRKSTFLFVPGTKVTFECFEDYVLTGDSTRECLANGTWNIPEYGYTKCLPQAVLWETEVIDNLYSIIELIQKHTKRN